MDSANYRLRCSNVGSFIVNSVISYFLARVKEERVASLASWGASSASARIASLHGRAHAGLNDCGALWPLLLLEVKQGPLRTDSNSNQVFCTLLRMQMV